MRFRLRGLGVAALAAATVLTGLPASAAARPEPPVQVAPLGPDFLFKVAASGYQS
ncbi:hypothetical protein ACFYV7_06935 [Nocardia suismassiliense]|uniref:Uncharacterized protein n=1 Tax=Nocardia suismassiliense TaxID=2077092 RepID=A0ABW6QPG7_9NOCA